MSGVNPKPSIEHSTRAFTEVLEPSRPLPSFPLVCIIEAMSERWDDHAAEDLVSGDMSDLSDASPSGRPMDPPRAAEYGKSNREAARAITESQERERLRSKTTA